MSLRTQFKSLLEPELMEGLVDQTLSLKIIRFSDGQVTRKVESLTLGPFPSWFTLYEVKLALWNSRRLPDKSRDPAFAPPFVFIGKPVIGDQDVESTVKTVNYKPIEMIWMNTTSAISTQRTVLELESPISRMTGPPDSRFVDSAGSQKIIGKDNRIRMTLNDIFQLDEGKEIPELHVFLYSDLVDRIPGPRPLGERDVYGRIMPYFPSLDPFNLPPASGAGAITQILINQAEQTAASLKQILYLEELLQTLGGELQLPKLDGVKFLRWIWNKSPIDWEGAAILFFGIKVLHERPFMRFFPGSGQPLTKIKVKGVLPIPDIADPNLLIGWKQDKNPDVGKDCAFIKMRLQLIDVKGELPIYSTMRVFSDGTADMIILPPKQKRLLDPYSDLQDAPEALDASLIDMPYAGQVPTLGQADVVFKIRLEREDLQITKALLQKRLKAFSSIFQEIPPLPDEQPLAMLRYKGVSNFSSEDRIFAFLTQIASHEMNEGEINETLWAPRVAQEFQLPIDEARKKVIEWTAQKNEYVLAVPETKDYILNKNPGVDIAIYAQHPIYNFHMYRVQSFQVYTTIVNLLGVLISAPANRFTERQAAVKAATVTKAAVGAPVPPKAPLSPAAQPTEIDKGADVQSVTDDTIYPDDDDLPGFMQGIPSEDIPSEESSNNEEVPVIGEYAKKIDEEDYKDMPEFIPNQGVSVQEESPVVEPAQTEEAPVEESKEAEEAPVEESKEAEENDEAVFLSNNDLPEFMRGGARTKTAAVAPAPYTAAVPPPQTAAPPPAAPLPEVRQPTVVPRAPLPKTVKPLGPPPGRPLAPPPIPPPKDLYVRPEIAPPVQPLFPRPAAAPPAVPREDDEDKLVAKAFEKPKDTKAIKVKKYYIERLKLADPDLFDYKHPTDRGYVSHCAANENRQPVVLDNDEYREMKKEYENDDDLEMIVYPEDPSPGKHQKKQPNKDENSQGKLDGKDYPAEDAKEIITLVKYGSKAKRVHYYFCPRLFCIRDRLMVRYKDFKSTKDRKGLPKPPNTCPFCKGTLVSGDIDKESDRDPNSTVLQRKVGPGSDSERKIYIGFLGTKKNPSGMSLPCCFSDLSDRFNPNDPEFVRLGLRPSGEVPLAKPQKLPDARGIVKAPGVADAQGMADAIMNGELEDTMIDVPEQPGPTISKYEPNYYRVIQAVSVKSIVDASRIPLEIVVPKTSAPDDPKAGPQIGLLPEALDTYFAQDSTSDKFAERVEIVRKLKPNAKGFLRLAVDNTSQNRNQFFLSAIAPIVYHQPNADKVVENYLKDEKTGRDKITAMHFMQLNGGNLVHEFYNKCEKKNQNDMRQWASSELAVDEFKSTNIPAIERLMNSYECFKNYINDARQKKDFRILYQAFSQPGIILERGLIFIILEVSVEDSTIKRGDKSEFKRDIKFERVRCPPYPLSPDQQKSDIAFVVHYSSVIRDRSNPEKKTYKTLAWEPLFYADGTLPTKDARHKPTLRFQRGEEASWPPIVQKRVSEFFANCVGMNRGPYTSQFGMNPNALISPQEIITSVRTQPNKMIRDSYNHLVALAFKISGRSEMISVPVADDGSILKLGPLLDWDDFNPAPADAIVDFYNNYIIKFFHQYRGYVPKYLQKSRETGKVIGVILQNGIAIPATEPRDPANLVDMKVIEVDDLEWDINRTIAYDSSLRKAAFEHADEEDIDGKKYVQLKMSSIQDEIEDVYQHLRLTFSNWLATSGAGSDKRTALGDVLKRNSLPLYEKRKRLDILLEGTVMKWFEPRDKEEDPDIGFLRVDCLVQDEGSCSGRCKWSSDDTAPGPGICKIHTPAKISPNGVVINVPRMLYLRLVDELIRYASKRQEIFSKQVPRLTIRQEAQRQGDQYIIPEGTPDWNSWWELLRGEWMAVDTETSKVFDEQYMPMAQGLPGSDRRTLPDSLRGLFGMEDPKTSRIVWNPSLNEDLPFMFLRSVLRLHPLTEKEEPILTSGEITDICKTARLSLIYIPDGSLETMSIGKIHGALDCIAIVSVNGTLGWLTQMGSYGVKIPVSSLPNVLSKGLN